MTAIPPRPAASESEDECSDTCRRMVCEWCPECDRQAALMEDFRQQLDALEEPA